VVRLQYIILLRKINVGKENRITKNELHTLIANLGYEEVKHLAPVFIGDTIYAKTKILDKVPSKSKHDRGIVYVETIAFNQRGEDVLSFRRKVLIKKQPTL